MEKPMAIPSPVAAPSLTSDQLKMMLGDLLIANKSLQLEIEALHSIIRDLTEKAQQSEKTKGE